MEHWNAKNFIKKSLLILTVSLSLSSCEITKHSAEFTDSKSATNITEKYWKLIALNGNPITMSATQEREIYMILKADSSKVKGFTGCNYFAGNYQLMKNRKIKFINFVAGEKHCTVPTQEYNFLNALKSADGFKTKQDTLWLSSKNASIARFEAVYF